MALLAYLTCCKFQSRRCCWFHVKHKKKVIRKVILMMIYTTDEYFMFRIAGQKFYETLISINYRYLFSNFCSCCSFAVLKTNWKHIDDN